MSKQDIIRFHDGAAGMAVDLTYFPLTIYAWFGAPTLPLIDEYYKVRKTCDDRARAQKTKVIIVNDLGLSAAPPATVRKALADRSKETDKSDALIGYVTVVPNPLVRGVVTALSWIAGDQAKPNVNLANMPLTLRHALKEFEKMDVVAPNIDPASYVSPSQHG